MGRNNIEDNSKAYNFGFNYTQQRLFKFGIKSEQACRRFELAQGLEMHKLTLTIQVDAKRYNFNINDKIELKGKSYIVVAIGNNFDNPNQGRYKNSLDLFTGSCLIGLE